jgi:membrane protein required for colicin V production
MNEIDIAILVTIVVFGVLGFYWGLIRQALALVGLIAGIILAGRYSGVVADALSSYVPNIMLAQALGFVFVLALVSALTSLCATLLRRFVGLLFLRPFDHVLGGVLGVIQAGLVWVALLIAGAAFPHSLWTPLVNHSTLAPLLVRLFEPVLLLMPPTFGFAAKMTFGI